MHSLHYLLAEELIKERQHELEIATNRPGVEPRARRGVRHTLASTFVRVGLRLDPSAGEGLPAFDVTLAGEGGGC
jgi:hypothetical protein